jgi:hypothetical protein
MFVIPLIALLITFKNILKLQSAYSSTVQGKDASCRRVFSSLAMPTNYLLPSKKENQYLNVWDRANPASPYVSKLPFKQVYGRTAMNECINE